MSTEVTQSIAPSVERTMADVNKDYSNACARLGEVELKMEVMKINRVQILNELNKINEEAHSLSQKAAQ